MLREKLSIRVFEAVMAFAAAFLMVIAPVTLFANGMVSVNAMTVIASIVCYLFAVMAVVFGIANIKGHNKAANSLAEMNQTHHAKVA